MKKKLPRVIKIIRGSFFRLISVIFLHHFLKLRHDFRFFHQRNHAEKYDARQENGDSAESNAENIVEVIFFVVNPRDNAESNAADTQ